MLTSFKQIIGARKPPPQDCADWITLTADRYLEIRFGGNQIPLIYFKYLLSLSVQEST